MATGRLSTGHLSIVGLGPGDASLLTEQARQVLQRADRLYGYQPYLDRLQLAEGQQAFPSDNRVEAERACEALKAACEGYQVAMVSGGDPGVFAMASAVCEQIEAGPAAFKQLDVDIVPGISAMLAAAAACGAPLGNDFCAISLSNNLKPWTLIEHRLRMAARAGFAMAFYNPISKARPWQLGQAFGVLREELADDIPVIFSRAITRPDQEIRVSTLAEAQAEWADMSTLIIIGTEHTRIIAREGRSPLIYTPRYIHQ